MSAAIRDISDRKRVETTLRASLSEEKEVLLKEIPPPGEEQPPGRLQPAEPAGGSTLRRDAAAPNSSRRARVGCVDGAVHEKLYQSRDLSPDRLRRLHRLARDTPVCHGHGVNPDDGITRETRPEDIPLAVDAAIRAG